MKHKRCKTWFSCFSIYKAKYGTLSDIWIDIGIECIYESE